MAVTRSTPTKFAILGQRKLKSRTDIVGARRHNMREQETLNADTTKPKPVVIFGPADAWQGVRDRLAELEIKPGKNAVLALELMMTTSPEWWLPDEDGYAIQRQAYERMAWKYLRGRFPEQAIVSLIWHLDETTPHLHVIVVPIRQRVDGRFKDRRLRWTLSARGDLSHAAKGPDGKPLVGDDGKPVMVEAGDWRGGIGGIQHMAREQTIFADIMAPLGLVRGAERSDGVHKPNALYQAELRIERDGLVRERSAVAEEADRQKDVAAELAVMTQALAAERAAHADHVRQRESELARHRAALAQGQRDLEDAREKARAWQAKARARAAELDGLERQERAIAKREREADAAHAALDERSDAIAELADAARIALSLIDTRLLPPELRPRIVRAAHDFGVAFDNAARVDRVVRSVTKGPIATPARAI